MVSKVLKPCMLKACMSKSASQRWFSRILKAWFAEMVARILKGCIQRWLVCRDCKGCISRLNGSVDRFENLHVRDGF